MGIDSIGSVPAALSQAATGDAVAVAVLRKTLDLQAQNAAQLLQALPPPSAGQPVGPLGNNVNTFA